MYARNKHNKHRRNMDPGENPDFKFRLGALHVTREAVDALAAAKVNCLNLLSRHVRGDFGENYGNYEAADMLPDGARIVSEYVLPTEVRIQIITGRDRTKTTIALKGQMQ